MSPRVQAFLRGRSRHSTVSVLLALGILTLSGLTLSVPQLDAQEGERLASAPREETSARRTRPAPAALEVEVREDLAERAESAEEPSRPVEDEPSLEADSEGAAPTTDYAVLRDALPDGLRELSPVVLADHVPLAWWSEVTDSWLLEPARQRRRMPRRCRTRGGYREHCSGARVVPEPEGEAAAIARYFGLGERGTAMVMMHRESFPEWMALVEGELAEDVDAEERLTFPVPSGHMGRGFGFTRTGELRRRRHQGLDIGGDRGATVVAARGGIVVYSDNGITGYGNMVMILHPGGDATFYAHCQATFVAAGQRVARGERIAEVGDTGFAGGPHLHFELRRNGWPRDPRRRFLRPGHAGETAR